MYCVVEDVPTVAMHLTGRHRDVHCPSQPLLVVVAACRHPRSVGKKTVHRFEVSTANDKSRRDIAVAVRSSTMERRLPSPAYEQLVDEAMSESERRGDDTLHLTS